MPKAYSYIRFSRPEQMRGDSLRRQTSKAAAWAAKRGLVIDESLTDLGVSAFCGANRIEGALGRFHALVEKGEVPRGSYLIIESLDRFSRRAGRQVLPDFLALINAGIIVTLIDEQVYSARRIGYRPLIEQAELPKALQVQLAAFGTALLEHVRVEQTRHRIAEAEGEAAREAGHGGFLEEALARVAMLEAELARLRVAPPAAASPAQPPEPEPVNVPAPMHLNPVYGKVRDRHTAEATDPVWADVRVAVARVLEQRGLMWVHAIHLSLPDQLKDRAERAGLPLTPAWLRLHLIRLADADADAGDGFAEVEGRFAVAAPVEAATEPAPVALGADAPPLSAERFWKLFVAEVHDLLREKGPLTAEEILEGLPDGWVAGTERYEPIKPGRLRQKLRERIRNKRPLEERPGKVFAATG